mmetsp:Transcript_33423/g.105310  ORF Transcript_33423/g.105310 Transcript_33423/m.105310 type:complete len:346 (-) Transcript_33423:1942-2979(-)
MLVRRDDYVRKMFLAVIVHRREENIGLRLRVQSYLELGGVAVRELPLVRYMETSFYLDRLQRRRDRIHGDGGAAQEELKVIRKLTDVLAQRSPLAARVSPPVNRLHSVLVADHKLKGLHHVGGVMSTQQSWPSVDQVQPVGSALGRLNQHRADLDLALVKQLALSPRYIDLLRYTLWRRRVIQAPLSPRVHIVDWVSILIEAERHEELRQPWARRRKSIVVLQHKLSCHPSARDSPVFPYLHAVLVLLLGGLRQAQQPLASRYEHGVVTPTMNDPDRNLRGLVVRAHDGVILPVCRGTERLRVLGVGQEADHTLCLGLKIRGGVSNEQEVDETLLAEERVRFQHD